jgi:hypothetical protein
VRDARLALAAIVTAAAVLRFVGLRFGLPAIYNPDEIAIMSRALAFAKGDFNPHNFLYPTFYFYVLFGWIGTWFVAVRAIGLVESLAAFQRQFFIDPSAVYLAGRALGAIAGTATVVAVFFLGRRCFGTRAALGAAAFLAVAPLHVRDSHYVKHDVFVTLLIVLACLAMLRLLASEDGMRLGPVFGAGTACGVAFSTHYYAVFLALPLAYAVWRWAGVRGRTLARGLSAAGASATVTFLTLSPFILAEPRTAWRDIVANREIVVDRAIEGAAPLANAAAYARMLTVDAAGWPIALLAAAGIVLALTRRTAADAPGRDTRVVAIGLLLFPSAFLIFIANTVAASRYLNPVLPFLVVFAGFGAARLAQVATRGRAALTAVLVGLALLPGAAASIRSDLFFRQDDTRTLALRYVERRWPSGSSVLVQPYSAPLVQSRASLVEALEANLGDLRRASTKFALRLQLEDAPTPSYRTIYLGDGGLDADKIYVHYGEFTGDRGLAAVRARGVRYLVVKRYNRPDPETLPFLSAVAREARRVAVFSPYRRDVDPNAAEPFLHNTDARIVAALERPGPIVELWELIR